MPRVPANLRGVRLLSVIGEQGWVLQRDADGRLMGVVGPGTLFPAYTPATTRAAFVESQRSLMRPWFASDRVQQLRRDRRAAGTLHDHARDCDRPSCPGAGADDDLACLFLVDGRRATREQYAAAVGWEMRGMDRRAYPQYS